MNFQFYVEKLINSDIYKDFIKKNKDAFCCSGFFVIDKQGKDNQQHFDYLISSSKDEKISSIQLENSTISQVEFFEGQKPEKISFDLEFDFNDAERIIEEKMQQENIKNKVQKMLFSLQKKNGKHFLVGTVFITGLGLIKALIDIEEMKLKEFEKKSFFDVMKVRKG